MQESTQLFGSDKRTRYLIGVATHGPIAGRALGRLLTIDSGELPELYRLFSKMGVIARDESKRIRLNEDFFAFSELSVLLHALAGRRVIVIPDGVAKRARIKPPDRLFGTPSRTRVLLALHALGSASLADLAFVSGVPARTVGAIVTTFASRRILATSNAVHELVAEFDESHRCAAPLHALLSLMLDALPRIVATAKFLGARKAEAIRSLQGTAATAPMLPMGTAAQAQAMVALSRFGPMTTNTLAERTRSSRSTTRTVMQELERFGLALRATVGSGRARFTWIALNEAHPLTGPMRRYIANIAPDAPTRALRELPPRKLLRTKPVKTRKLPGHKLRIRVLVETFEAGEISVSDLGRRIRQPDLGRIRRWAQELHTAGLIEYGLVRGTPTLRINDAATSAVELKALVAAMARFARGP